MTSSPTRAELYEVAKVTARILKSSGLPCFLVGGMACAAYGTSRLPNDIDMAIMTDEDQESVKLRLVLGDPRFYLINSKNPNATYKVLWFRLSTPYSWRRRSCKVDILQRGTLNIPDVPPSRIREVQGVPVAPLLVLLCLKLQGWEDHGAAPEWRYRSKQPADVGDINELLAIAVASGEKISKESWIPSDFVRQAEIRVPKYIRSMNTHTMEQWRALGLLHRRELPQLHVGSIF